MHNQDRNRLLALRPKPQILMGSPNQNGERNDDVCSPFIQAVVIKGTILGHYGCIMQRHHQLFFIIGMRFKVALVLFL
jgi:hypothetical protein